MSNWADMTNEELVAEYQQTNDNELFEYFVERNNNLLFYGLKTLINNRPDDIDVITNIVMTAMWKAMKTFNTKLNIKFSTWYLANRKGSFRDYNEDEYYSVHLPEYLRHNKDFDKNKLFFDSLDREVGIKDDSLTTLGEIIADNNILPEELAIQKDNANIVLDAVKQLKPRERIIIIKRFGLEDGKFRTLEEIGQDFGVTRERIRQLEVKALKKLRKLLKNKID